MKYKSFSDFFKREVILCAALTLAAVSCFFVPPDVGYLSYIDCRTLALLFSLMAVMAGFREQGVFLRLGKYLLTRASGMRRLVFVLVMLCFFFSMLITNDVALITFVPFAFTVFEMLGTETRREWILPVVCMQTIAANLGSMLTPIGNPQNLYLYERSGLTFFAFLRLMLPYAAASLLLLAVWILFLCRKRGRAAEVSVDLALEDKGGPDMKKTALYAALFILCLLTVIHVLPYTVLLCAVLAALLCFDRKILCRVDYSLLLTFVGFFIFVGNLGRISVFSEWLRTVLSGREVPVSVLASQVISNVPAALLLSGFTGKISALIVGTNLGGLGTLIASMASLISFRQIAIGERDGKGKYFILFTLSNVVFLAVLLCVWKIIPA